MSKIYKEFGDLIRRLRVEQGLSQYQLRMKLQDQECSISSNGTVSKWENGSNRPKSEIVDALEDILHTRPGLLLHQAKYHADAESKERSQGVSVNTISETHIAERLKSNLQYFCLVLLDWIYPYASEMSGLLKEYFYSGYWHTENFKNDIPLLEDIFGIAVYKFDGTQLRGTNKKEFKEKILRFGIDASAMYEVIIPVFGFRAMEEIEKRLNTFPGLLNMVSQNVAEIANLRSQMQIIYQELEKWVTINNPKNIYTIDDSGKNVGIRATLRILGRKALDIAIAINVEINRLDSTDINRPTRGLTTPPLQTLPTRHMPLIPKRKIEKIIYHDDGTMDIVVHP